ncbi:hypothetical protein [Haploplasma modicum]|uniref:hypothetical protein n=1 Tax=Haploplasma modicum TaxID=2150 RepID=UPI00214CD226|nr:hypothetical protein [Haploplasma modicum]MCR1808794.1 hypothetical protein [Haploplasma modicum]
MSLIEIYEYNNSGYAKLMSYKEWRVAMLNFANELKIENIDYVEAHNMTDEVFVLLSGSCQMILMDFQDEQLKKIEIVNLEPNKIYNIPKNIHHSHVLSPNTKLLIIEQEDTSDHNSNRIYLTSEIKYEMQKKWREMIV